MGLLQHSVLFATSAPNTFLTLLHRSQCSRSTGAPAHVTKPLWVCASKPQKRSAKKVRQTPPITRIQLELQRGLTIFRKDMIRFRQRLLRITRRNDDKMRNVRMGGQVAEENLDTTATPEKTGMELAENGSKTQPEVFPAYKPRSVTGQAVAERFSTLRGTMTRTLDVTLLNVREALRTAANVLMSVAVKIVPGLPAADSGRTSSGWRLLSSFQWQAPSELLERTGDFQNNLRSVIGKARKKRVEFVKNRTKEDKILRMLGSSATSAGSLLGGTRNAISGLVTLYRGRQNEFRDKRIGTPQGGGKSDQKSLTRFSSKRESIISEKPLYKPAKMASLERMIMKDKVGKKGGAIVAAGVITVVGGLVGGGLSLSTVVSCSAIVATSAAVVSGRIDSITPPSRRNRKVYVNPLDDSQKRKNYVPRSRSRLAPMSQMQKFMLEEETGEQKEETWIGADRLTEVEEESWGLDESLETTAYSVGPAKPWLVSVPLIGDVLKMLDSVAFMLERGLKSMFRTLGVPMKDSRVEGGWVILNTLHANRYNVD